MPTYERARAEFQELLEDVRDAHYPDLVKAELRIALLFAHGARDEDGAIKSPAIKHHGVKAAGLAKIVPLKDRALGMPDAVVIVDGDEWPDWSEDRRRALLDHELHHFDLQIDEETGDIKADDLGRPKLKIRPHDFEVGWFEVVARRHGAASFEVEQAAFLADGNGQLLFPWAPDAKPAAKATISIDSPAIVRDAFAALMSVGYTEQQARDAVDVACEGGRTFASVAEMIDAVYAQKGNARPRARRTTAGAHAEPAMATP